MSLVFALTITPAQSFKLAQATATQQTSSKKSDIKKTKDNLQNKIDQLSKSSVRGVSQLVSRLISYMSYLSYLEINLATQNPDSLSSKLDKIGSAIDNIFKIANDVIKASGADVTVSTSTISDSNVDSVTQTDTGLSYSPISGAVTSGEISGGATTGGGTPATPSP